MGNMCGDFANVSWGSGFTMIPPKGFRGISPGTAPRRPITSSAVCLGPICRRKCRSAFSAPFWPRSHRTGCSPHLRTFTRVGCRARVGFENDCANTSPKSERAGSFGGTCRPPSFTAADYRRPEPWPGGWTLTFANSRDSPSPHALSRWEREIHLPRGRRYEPQLASGARWGQRCADAEELSGSWGRRHAIVEHFRWASESLVLNIAEGARLMSGPDKARTLDYF